MIDKTEQEIMAEWKGDVSQPVVSICSITYNHEKYIEEALDSFLMQETDFPFEIVIDDDCSTDATAGIIEKYIEKYPNIINANLRDKNVGATRNFLENMKRAKGEYIALCEGDDYWVDNLKLHKQVKLLDKHPNCSMCVAYTDYYKDSENCFEYIKTLKSNDKEIQTFEDIKRFNYHTSSYVLKTKILYQIIKNISAKELNQMNEMILRFMLFSYGYFVLVPEVMSVYRITGLGIWTSLSQEKQWDLQESTSKILIRNLQYPYSLFHGELLFNLYKNKMLYYLQHGFIFQAFKSMSKVFLFGLRYKMPKLLNYVRTR